MRRINIYIADPQYAEFQRLARERGRPYSELIREALDHYLRPQVLVAREPAARYGASRKGRAKKTRT